MNNCTISNDVSEPLTLQKLNEMIDILPKGIFGEPMFHGINIVPNPYLMDEKEKVIKRIWRERLFGLPWNPFKSTRIETYQVPSTKLMEVPMTNKKTWFCHPNFYNTIKSHIDCLSGLNC